MHHIVAHGFVDRPRRSDCTAGQMDGEAGWWTTSGNIGLPPLARVMGVGRQHHMVEAYSSTGLVMALYVSSMVFLCLPHLVEVYVSVVSEFGVKCESWYFWMCGHGKCCVSEVLVVCYILLGPG